MKASDLREKGSEDLRELEKSLAHDVFQNRLKNFTNRLDDTSAIGKTKRELARVTTLLREVELGIKRGPGAATKAADSTGTKVEAKAKGEPKAQPTPKKAPAKKTEGAPKAKTAKKSEAKKS
jgi:large subunit ribosomal protein L29